MAAPIIRRMLFIAARRLATDPELRRIAVEVFQVHVKPRAAAAWQNAKPRLAQTRADLSRIAEETDARRHPARFAGRAARRIMRRRQTPPRPDQE